MPRKPRKRHTETHRLRILKTLAAKEAHKDDAPTTQWYSNSTLRVVADLIAEGLLKNDAKGIRLTAAGLKLIAKLAGNGD